METINFFNTENMGLFWEYVQSLLTTAAPGVMLWFAIVAVGLVLTMVVKAWRESQKEDKDEDYDYREY